MSIAIKDHKFEPETLKVPVGKAIKLTRQQPRHNRRGVRELPTALREGCRRQAVRRRAHQAARGRHLYLLRRVPLRHRARHCRRGVSRMLAALVIVFREVLEAGLIVGVVLAASRGVAGRGRAVALGIAAGVAGSVVVAAFATRISAAFDGRGLELFTAAVLLLAVVMLTWHVVWMADHARDLTRELRELGQDVGTGRQSVAVLGVATATAVMREGSEVVLFLPASRSSMPIAPRHSRSDRPAASPSARSLRPSSISGWPRSRCGRSFRPRAFS